MSHIECVFKGSREQQNKQQSEQEQAGLAAWSFMEAQDESRFVFMTGQSLAKQIYTLLNNQCTVLHVSAFHSFHGIGIHSLAPRRDVRFQTVLAVQ